MTDTDTPLEYVSVWEVVPAGGSACILTVTHVLHKFNHVSLPLPPLAWLPLLMADYGLAGVITPL